MNLENRIDAFVRLGKHISEQSPVDLADLLARVSRENPWFTKDQVSLALLGVQKMLGGPALIDWTASYPLGTIREKTVGVAMAGNIPLVGFHDFLSVLISGHRIKTKLSSQDSVLMTYLANELIKIEPRFASQIQFSDRLVQIDAMIATGSDNTSRYFEYYFRNVPHIIRKNRSSCAIILGEESAEEFSALGADIFSYFGLGCRNISKLFVPENYEFAGLLESWGRYRSVLDHAKYFNNYEYQKSILIVNRIPFLDNGFVLLKEDGAMVSPIAVLYFETYSDQQDLRQKISRHKEKIQCIVSARKWFAGSEDFGQAQFPSLMDYADNVDTLRFLSEIGVG